MTAARAGLFTRFCYGFGAVAYGAKQNGFSYLLLYYYSQVVGLPAAWVSFGIFLALVVDAVSDPLVGYLSDNLESRWGRRHPFMYAAGLPAAIAFYFLWSPPDWSQPAQFAWFLGLAIAVRTLLTFYEVPSTALVAEFTDDYDERTRFMGMRYVFGWWGGLTMGVLVYLVFLPESKGGLAYVDGWQRYGMVAAAVIAVSVYVSALGTHHHIPHLRRAPARRLRLSRVLSEILETLSSRAFVVLLAAALLMAMAAGVYASLDVYFARHFWALTTQQIGLLRLPYFLSALAALWLAPALARRLGKKDAAIAVAAASVLFGPLPIVARLLDCFPANGTDALFYTLMAFSTVDVTLVIAAAILIGAMIADVVEHTELSTGRRSEGTLFAANSFAQKAVNGLGVVVAGQLLALADFPAEAVQGEVPTVTLQRLALAFVPTLVALYAIAIATLWFYPITRARHAANLERLRAGGA